MAVSQSVSASTGGLDGLGALYQGGRGDRDEVKTEERKKSR